jgi:hypothetical protein
VPQGFGPLVGQPAFEQARGILMEFCQCTAAQALTLMSEVASRTGSTAETVVATVHADPGRAQVLRLIYPDG